MVKIRGIDVSKWQGKIDWKKVKASGIEFAMIRIGHGDNGNGITMDSYFRENINAAYNAGIKVGIFFYSYAKNVQQAKAEADYVITNLKPYKNKIVYPVAYDLEDKSQAGLGRTMLTNMVVAFLNIIKNNGYKPAFYTNLDWIRNRLDMSQLEDFDLWLAQWAPRPTYDYPPTIWQYSSTGKVNGIQGNVDLNYGFFDYYAIDKLEKDNEYLSTRVSSLQSLNQQKNYTIAKYRNAGLYIEKLVTDALKRLTLTSGREAGKKILEVIRELK